MKEKPLPRIIAITQATGWVGVFTEEDGSITKSPVAVWAIIEEDGETRVCGMSQLKDPELDFDDKMSNFLCWEPV